MDEREKEVEMKSKFHSAKNVEERCELPQIHLHTDSISFCLPRVTVALGLVGLLGFPFFTNLTIFANSHDQPVQLNGITSLLDSESKLTNLVLVFDCFESHRLVSLRMLIRTLSNFMTAFRPSSSDFTLKSCFLLIALFLTFSLS